MMPHRMMNSTSAFQLDVSKKALISFARMLLFGDRSKLEPHWNIEELIVPFTSLEKRKKSPSHEMERRPEHDSSFDLCLEDLAVSSF